MEIQNTLKKIGLNDEEIAVYLSSLELGPSMVANIARHSGVKRTTVYLVAKSLIEKGLMGQYKAKRGIHLGAQPPEFLHAQMEEKTKEISNILPQLKALTKKESYLPQIKYFEGKEGYFTICEDTLQKHADEILWMGNPEEIYKIIGEKYDNEYYIPARLKKKIKLRALLFKNDWSQKFKEGMDYKFLRNIRLLPNEFTFHSTQLIYQDKVAFISSNKELISVLIKSRDLAMMEKAKFETIWKNSGKNF